MEEKGKESGHWLLFFLVVVVISFGVVASKYFGYQPPKGYFVTSIMLGMLTLFDSDVFDGLEETTVGSMGVTLFILVSPVAGWIWYDLLFSPTLVAWINFIVHLLFSGAFTIIIFLVALGAGIVSSEKNDSFVRQGKTLLFGGFLIIVPLYGGSVKQSLFAAIIAALLYSLSFPLLTHSNKNANKGKFLVAALGGFLSLQFSAFIFFEPSNVQAFLSVLAPSIPTSALWTWIVVSFIAGIVFSVSGFHWSTFVSAFLILCLVIIGGTGNTLIFVYSLISVALGLLVGLSRILLWPFLTIALNMQISRIEAAIDKQKNVERLRAAKLINVFVFPKLLGQKKILNDFAKNNFQYEFKYKNAKTDFFSAKEDKFAQDVLSTQSLEGISTLMHQSRLRLNDIAEKLQEGLKAKRITEQMRYFTSALRMINVSKETDEVKKHFKTLVYARVEPIKKTYWKIYDLLPGVSAGGINSLQGNKKIKKYEQKAITKIVNKEILSVKKLGEAVENLNLHLGDLSFDEETHYQTFTQISRQIITLSRVSNLQKRAEIVQDAMLRITNSRENMVDEFDAITLDKDEIVTHNNPWVTYFDALYQHLENIQTLNDAYILWANRQIVSTLSKTVQIEDLPSLEERLSNVTDFSIEYGGAVDLALVSLRQIGQEASAALAFPRGFSQRMGLQDTLDGVNKLRSILSTRYQDETKEYQENLNRIAEILLSVLFSIEEAHESGYRNPYQGTGNPIKLNRAALFKGREDIAQSLVTLFRSRGNPTLVLYGPRRMGKTSFLLQLPRLLPANYVPVYLDMQGGGAQQNDASFMYEIARAISRQLKTESNLAPPSLAEFENHPYTTLIPWLDDEVFLLLRDRKLFITIDEFEVIGDAIRRGSLTEQILGFLRHLMQHNENIILMFAGVRTIEALGPNPASYFITANLVEMSYLNKKEAEELIVNPDPSAGKMPEYDENVIAKILEITHCQPYLIQAICSVIIDIANSKNITRIEDKILGQAVEDILHKSLYFQNIWDDALSEGQAILKKLVDETETINLAIYSSEALKGLLHRHVIYKKSDGTYSIEIPLIATWISMQV